MSLDQQKVRDTQDWLHKSEQDLDMAKLAVEKGEGLLEPSLYHCQQAAEKAIKGFLFWHESKFQKTHDLAQLGGQAVDIDPTLKDVIQRTIFLTKYAFKFRYPGEPEKPEQEDADTAIEAAEDILSEIKKRLPQAVTQN